MTNFTRVFQNYPHPDDHTIRTTDIPGFKPFTLLIGYSPVNQNMTSEVCLSCIIRHPEHNKIKLDMAESEEALEGILEFSVQETSKDLSRNDKHIVLKQEQEAAIRV